MIFDGVYGPIYTADVRVIGNENLNPERSPRKQNKLSYKTFL